MKTKIEHRSMIIGIVLTICFVLAIGASQKSNTPPSHSHGRFQLDVGEGSFAYVIDTTTGQVWSQTPISTDIGKDFRKPKLIEKTTQSQ